MPNTHSTLESLFNDIAFAIRTKKGETSEEKYVADNFPAAIAGIPTEEYSTLTPIEAVSGTKSTGGSHSVSFTYTGTFISGAKLYCIICSDLYSTTSTILSYIVFKSDGTVVGRSASTVSVALGSNNDYTVTINRGGSSGITFYYTFRGFALA